jgi:hypothetical protein
MFFNFRWDSSIKRVNILICHETIKFELFSFLYFIPWKCHIHDLKLRNKCIKFSDKFILYLHNVNNHYFLFWTVIKLIKYPTCERTHKSWWLHKSEFSLTISYFSSSPSKSAFSLIYWIVVCFCICLTNFNKNYQFFTRKSLFVYGFCWSKILLQLWKWLVCNWKRCVDFTSYKRIIQTLETVLIYSFCVYYLNSSNLSGHLEYTDCIPMYVNATEEYGFFRTSCTEWKQADL